MTFYFIPLMTSMSSLIRHMVGKHKQEWLWDSDNVIQNTCTCFGSVDYTRYNNS